MKYKAEKRDWGVREKALQATIDRLRNENLDYRSATKAADFERQIQVGPCVDQSGPLQGCSLVPNCGSYPTQSSRLPRQRLPLSCMPDPERPAWVCPAC